MTPLTRDEALDLTGDPEEEELMFAEDLDAAIIGVARRNSTWVVVYSIAMALEALISQGMSSEEARDHFGYNVEGGWLGEQTPIWMET